MNEKYLREDERKLRISLADAAPDGEFSKLCSKVVEVLLSRLCEARARIEQLERENRWIPVSEGMPEEGITVLTFEDGQTTTNFVPYSSAVGVGKRQRGRFQSGHDFVTRWRPLPSPPTGEVR